MKIAICWSMSASNEMMVIEKELIRQNHEVILPRNTKKYAESILAWETPLESTQNKIKHNLLCANFETAKWADVMLIANVDKKEVSNYIGGNTFLEMWFAHVLNKPIFLLNNIPEVTYKDEILAMQPTVINWDFSKIK